MKSNKSLKVQKESQYTRIEKVQNLINNLLQDERYIENTNYQITIEDENNLVFRELEHPYVKITGRTVGRIFSAIQDLYPEVEINIIGGKVARFTLGSAWDLIK